MAHRDLPSNVSVDADPLTPESTEPPQLGLNTRGRAGNAASMDPTSGRMHTRTGIGSGRNRSSRGQKKVEKELDSQSVDSGYAASISSGFPPDLPPPAEDAVPSSLRSGCDSLPEGSSRAAHLEQHPREHLSLSLPTLADPQQPQYRKGGGISDIFKNIGGGVQKLVNASLSPPPSQSSPVPSFTTSSDRTSRALLDSEVAAHLQYMPYNLREDYRDGMILYSEEDRKEVIIFRSHLHSDVMMFDKIKPKIVLYDEIAMSIGSRLKALEFGLERCTYIFLYITQKFCEDTWTEFSGETCLMEAVYNPDKKWCVVPVFTEPKRRTSYKVPVSINSLKGVQYWSNLSNDKFYVDSVKKLLEEKFMIRRDKERELKKKRIKWVMKEKQKHVDQEIEMKKEEMEFQRQQNEHDAALAKLLHMSLSQPNISGHSSHPPSVHPSYSVPLDPDAIKKICQILETVKIQAPPDSQPSSTSRVDKPPSFYLDPLEQSANPSINNPLQGWEGRAGMGGGQECQLPVTETFQGNPPRSQLVTASQPPQGKSYSTGGSAEHARTTASSLCPAQIPQSVSRPNIQSPPPPVSINRLSSNVEADHPQGQTTVVTDKSTDCDSLSEPIQQRFSSEAVRAQSSSGIRGGQGQNKSVPPRTRTLAGGGREVEREEKLKEIHYHYHYHDPVSPPPQLQQEQQQQPINIVGSKYVMIGEKNQIRTSSKGLLSSDEEEQEEDEEEISSPEVSDKEDPPRNPSKADDRNTSQPSGRKQTEARLVSRSPYSSSSQLSQDNFPSRSGQSQMGYGTEMADNVGRQLTSEKRLSDGISNPVTSSRKVETTKDKSDDVTSQTPQMCLADPEATRFRLAKQESLKPLRNVPRVVGIAKPMPANVDPHQTERKVAAVGPNMRDNTIGQCDLQDMNRTVQFRQDLHDRSRTEQGCQVLGDSNRTEQGQQNLGDSSRTEQVQQNISDSRRTAQVQEDIEEGSISDQTLLKPIVSCAKVSLSHSSCSSQDTAGVNSRCQLNPSLAFSERELHLDNKTEKVMFSKLLLKESMLTDSGEDKTSSILPDKATQRHRSGENVSADDSVEKCSAENKESSFHSGALTDFSNSGTDVDDKHGFSQSSSVDPPLPKQQLMTKENSQGELHEQSETPNKDGTSKKGAAGSNKCVVM